MTLPRGDCAVCTNLHILLRTAEKHRLERSAASAQVWGASPNLRYGELFDTHGIRKKQQQKKSEPKGARTQDVDSICSIVHKHLLLLQCSFVYLHSDLHLQPVLSLFPTCLHLCTERLLRRVRHTLRFYQGQHLKSLLKLQR